MLHSPGLEKVSKPAALLFSQGVPERAMPAINADKNPQLLPAYCWHDPLLKILALDLTAVTRLLGKIHRLFGLGQVSCFFFLNDPAAAHGAI